jgi:CRISPR/Cas system-associated endonuclease Cas3-HD
VVFLFSKSQAEVKLMIVKEYCESMQKQLAAWRANVQKLLLIAEAVEGKDRQEGARQIANLQAIIHDLGKVSDMLKYECLPA